MTVSKKSATRRLSALKGMPSVNFRLSPQRGSDAACRNASILKSEGNPSSALSAGPAPVFYSQAAVGTVRLTDGVLSARIGINHMKTIPENLRKCEESGRFRAFDLQWKPGMPEEPHVFWDSDVAKVLEGMAEDLILHPDPEREALLNGYVDRLLRAQRPDGYLNSHFTVVEPEKRWDFLQADHELYCAGHLFEAAAAHFRATGKRNFLDAMLRYADLIGTVFGRAPGQRRGYPGHEEIELALCKLSDLSGNPKYTLLAKYFIDERGVEPNYFLEEDRRHGIHRNPSFLKNLQADKPVREQTGITGHAVRAMYLCCGMADVAARTGDRSLLELCERLWDSTVNRKMYLTGGIGSTAHGEAFEADYRLPNDTAYAESCAAIGLALFSSRMLCLTGAGKYADAMERVIFNGVLSGISLDGTRFFYENRMQLDSTTASSGAYPPERLEWFDCSCCPTNFCRFLPRLGSFVCSHSGNEVRIDIPSAMTAELPLESGPFAFSLESGYPFDGEIRVKILRSSGTNTLSLRIPGWCAKFKLSVNGAESGRIRPDSGYVSLKRAWVPGDETVLSLDMPVRCVRANSMVEADAGRIALMRGPVVYVLESTDNPGLRLSGLLVPADQSFEVVPAENLPSGTLAIRGKAFVEKKGPELYSGSVPEAGGVRPFTAIPYALRQNRGPVTEFLVWLREKL